MLGLALTVAPIFAIVVLGLILRRLRLPGDGFWPMASRLGYYVLIPSLLFNKLSTAEVSLDLLAPFALGLCGAFFAVGAAVLVVTRFLRQSGGVRGSILQGAVRHNSFMALALAEKLYGVAGLSMAALAAAVLALITNLSIVPALRLLEDDPEIGVRPGRVLRDIACNPLIVSICLGLAVNALIPFRIPVLHDATAMLGAVALPLMLMCVGAGLALKGIRARLVPLLIAAVGRFVIFPAVLLALVLPTGLETQAVVILLMFAATPTAPSSTALAAETGGDVPLMNTIVTFQTALAFVTLPVTLVVVLHSLS